MRKKRIIGVLLVVAGVLAYLGQAIAFKLQDKKEIEDVSFELYRFVSKN